MDFSYIYEIDRTVDFITSRNFTRVALQFPDELLKDSRQVVKALYGKLKSVSKYHADENKNTESREVNLYVMADTLYGSCCVDEVGASHIGAKCVIHYGHSCFSPTSTLPALFVFGKASISTLNCAENISKLLSNQKKPILVLFGLEFSHAILSLKEALAGKVSQYVIFAEVLCSFIDPSKDSVLSRKQVDGNDSETCEAEAGFSIGGLTWKLPQNHKIEDYLLFWIGPGNSAFSNILLTFNSCEIVRYEATENDLVSDFFQQSRMLKRRYFLVEKAKDANIVGILVGTLGVAGYLDMINQMKQLITRSGKKPYIFVMGRPNPAKLANFPECDVFIYVSCAQTALLDSKEFLAPIITPFEAEIAFGRGKQWTGEYNLQFRDLIHKPVVDVGNDSEEARYSFFQGGYVADLDQSGHTEHDTEVGSILAVATEKSLRINNKHPHSLVKSNAKSGAEFLAGRSYQGLEMHDDSSPAPLLIGRTGRAAGYNDEKQHL